MTWYKIYIKYKTKNNNFYYFRVEDDGFYAVDNMFMKDWDQFVDNVNSQDFSRDSIDVLTREEYFLEMI